MSELLSKRICVLKIGGTKHCLSAINIMLIVLKDIIKIILFSAKVEIKPFSSEVHTENLILRK